MEELPPIFEESGEIDSWKELADCREADPDIFFPGTKEEEAQAKRICAGCSVADLCLKYALEAREPFGIWGGASEKDRRRMRRARP